VALWDEVPAIRDGSIIGDDEGNPILATNGTLIGYDAGWRKIDPEVDPGEVGG